MPLASASNSTPRTAFSPLVPNLEFALVVVLRLLLTSSRVMAMAAMSSRCAAISGWSSPSWAGQGASVESAAIRRATLSNLICSVQFVSHDRHQHEALLLPAAACIMCRELMHHEYAPAQPARPPAVYHPGASYSGRASSSGAQAAPLTELHSFACALADPFSDTAPMLLAKTNLNFEK